MSIQDAVRLRQKKGNATITPTRSRVILPKLSTRQRAELDNRLHRLLADLIGYEAGTIMQAETSLGAKLVAAGRFYDAHTDRQTSTNARGLAGVMTTTQRATK